MTEQIIVELQLGLIYSVKPESFSNFHRYTLPAQTKPFVKAHIELANTADPRTGELVGYSKDFIEWINESDLSQ